jgi:hypothetical protein
VKPLVQTPVPLEKKKSLVEGSSETSGTSEREREKERITEQQRSARAKENKG